MKIKTTKKLNLPELIQHVWENEVYPSVWRREESPSNYWTIQFFEDGMFRGHTGFHEYDTFTVEVEEELTEDILLDRITIFFYDTQTRNNGFGTYRDLSIQEALEMNRGTLKFISMAVDDALIWSKDIGIPEHGVLEVDTE